MLEQVTRTRDDREALLDRLLLKESVSEFYRKEGDLLDMRRLTEWLDLFDADARYTIPLQRNLKLNQLDKAVGLGQIDVAWAADTKDTLIQRVDQLQTGMHWADEPYSRYTHITANVGFRDVPVAEGCVATRCRFVVYRNRGTDETDFFIGLREDVLRHADDGFLIKERVVLIQQNVLLAKNLSMFF